MTTVKRMPNIAGKSMQNYPRSNQYAV